MKLADFQALFQSRILSGAGAGDAPLVAALSESPRGAERETLLGVYQSGYRVRLESFLEEDHPGLRAVLGDDAFETLIGEYVSANPPRNRNARWYTTGLPDYLSANPRWRDNRRALSMALFERALVDAFDAPDAEPLTLRALAAFAPEDSPRLVFAFHPSLILLELAAGTIEAYEAARAEPGEADEGGEASLEVDDKKEPFEEGVEYVAVWRIDEETAYRELEPDEHVALSEAKAGRAFGDICQMAAFQQSGEIEPERLAQFLASWFEDGMAADASLQG
jgi:hypothetical protein